MVQNPPAFCQPGLYLSTAPCARGKYALWVGEGSVAGELYDLGAYPGILLLDERGERIDVPGEVHGEIYAITPELEQMLDEIEEVWPQQTGEYTKREVAVQLLNGASPAEAAASTGDIKGQADHPSKQRLVCLLYEIAPQLTVGKPLIPGGDWVAHRLQV